MNILSLGVSLVLFVLSLLFWLEKAPKALIDFEKINKEEKGKLNAKAMSRNLGVVFFLLGIIFLGAGIFSFFREKYFLFAVIAWVAIVFLDIWIIGKSKRYLRK